MKTPQIMLLNVFALAILATAGIANADEITKEGYLTDSRGEIVRSGTGLCWHTSSWTPAMAIEGCDPVAKHAATVIAEATPTQASAPAAQKKTVFVPYTLQTETLFVYNKSELSESGKNKIHNEINDKIKEHSEDEVLVISGYTDRIGSEEYNMKLSQRRADAVKAYLVDQGIADSRIETVAKGEADPIVACDNIKGKANHKNKALIACLQPNRRIVLDFKAQNPVQK